MKKVVIVIVGLIMVIIVSVLFLPKRETINFQIPLKCNIDAASRLLFHKNNLAKWWPGEIKAQAYLYNDQYFYFDKTSYADVAFKIALIKDSMRGVIQFIKDDIQEDAVTWYSTYNYSTDFFVHIREYLEMKKIKNNLHQFLAAVKNKLEQEDVLYGIKIIRDNVKDSSYISIKKQFVQPPVLIEIYTMVHQLENYCKLQNVKVNGAPMLNIHQTGKNKFDAMVALPITHDIPEQEPFYLKKMALGSLLHAQVRGGFATVSAAEQSLDNYVQDHKMVSPAIPYQSLTTNRMAEPDTAKWITDLYYPIF